ncbi:hypothetical protein HaLaN_12153 [Haematococcus lacustris]|uniref:Uncharacterized protein n=1 Tax=Haematococcus lacustris TaxID=44745 RepID=A0A699Z2R9_HAELA|nr:hypothetical protein HaLaN_12153 [Haematococcus lacustris]
MECLQEQRDVFDASGGRFTVDRQSDLELGLVVRSMYLQHAHHDVSIPVVEQHDAARV